MIEVMVAVLLTAIAASGIIGLYIAETRASGYSRRQTEATVLAQDQLERLRTLAAMVSDSESGLNAQGLVVTGGIYDRQWTITPASMGYEDIVVTVSWDDDGVPKAVTMRARRNAL